MFLTVDPASSDAVYEQLCDQVKHAVATGALTPGDRLPTIREVAVSTRVNRNTVARAYSELERDGVIVSRPGRGSFVAEGASTVRHGERMRILEKLARRLLVEAYHLQVPRRELHQLIERLERELDEPKEEVE